MPRVLGIDTSLTATGLARIDYGGPDAWTVETATVSAPPPARNGDRSKRAMARRVNALLAQIEPAFQGVDAVGMEGLAYAAKGDSAWVLPWVFGRVIELCERFDVPLTIVGTSQRAKYATGKGTADKDTVLLAAARQWPDAGITNNNEADATVVAAVVCQQHGWPVCPETAYRADVLTKVGN